MAQSIINLSTVAQAVLINRQGSYLEIFIPGQSRFDLLESDILLSDLTNNPLLKLESAVPAAVTYSYSTLREAVEQLPVGATANQTVLTADGYILCVDPNGDIRTLHGNRLAVYQFPKAVPDIRLLTLQVYADTVIAATDNTAAGLGFVEQSAFSTLQSLVNTINTRLAAIESRVGSMPPTVIGMDSLNLVASRVTALETFTGTLPAVATIPTVSSVNALATRMTSSEASIVTLTDFTTTNAATKTDVTNLTTRVSAVESGLAALPSAASIATLSQVTAINSSMDTLLQGLTDLETRVGALEP